MTHDLPGLLGLLKEHLGAANARLDGFQQHVADLVGRAGADIDPHVIQEMQAIDRVVQNLARLADVIDALRCAAPEINIALPPSSVRMLDQMSRDAVIVADCELF